MDIIKPNNDNRNYKYCVLENNIKCVLINDNLLDKTIVVTSINVGSFGDKEYYSGMAHLLEHMCFITSKKYKTKNYLANKISELGGNVNAYTDELSTVYYFDVFTENLETILEIFIDFLINAELNENYILDELNNVDSEHQKNINDDGWRLYNLEKTLANKKSNYNNFSTGTTKTLNKPDIYKKMVDFYNKYYNSNNISISIASNKSINNLYKIVNKYFGAIKKPVTNNQAICKLIKPIYTNNKGKTYLMQSISDLKILEYIFELVDFEIELNNTKIYNLFSNIINSSEKNLCNDYLKSLGFIENLNSNLDLNAIFKISISLTNKGMNNINFINNYIINYINKIFLLDWNKILIYNKNKYNFLFNNTQKIETMDLCTSFLQNLLYYKPNNIYYTNFNYDIKYNNNFKKILQKNINFNNCLRIIVNKNFNCKNYNTCEYYGTKYCELINYWDYQNINIDINYNFINKYSNYKPIINNSNNEIPILINKNIWYGSTTKFNELVIYCNIIFSNINYFNNITNYLLTICSIYVLNQYMYKELYKAYEYNYSANLNSDQTTNSIILKLIFYDISFINDVLNLLNNPINISDELILSVILIIKDDFESIKYINPWSYCDYIFNNSYENNYLYTDLLKELLNININDIKEYINNIIKNCGTKIFIYGNIKNVDFLKNLQNLYNLNTYNICKFPKIKLKKIINCKHPNINEKENCVKISYFTGKFHPKKNLYLIFVKLITHNLFFDELRTNQKLGYLVSMYSSIIGNQYFIYQKIQSKIPCKKIINYINNFNNTLIENIKKINLEKWKETVINHLNIKENNTEDLINKYFSEILNNTFVFNRNKLLLKYIDNVTNTSLCKFINKYIINNKNKNIVQIYS
jgi:insulysin